MPSTPPPLAINADLTDPPNPQRQAPLLRHTLLALLPGVFGIIGAFGFLIAPIDGPPTRPYVSIGLMAAAVLGATYGLVLFSRRENQVTIGQVVILAFSVLVSLPVGLLLAVLLYARLTGGF